MTRRTVLTDVRAVAPAWVVARLAVALGWAGALLWTAVERDGVRSEAMGQGLFAWDGVFYRGIAEHGYRGEALEALRFFPLFPLLGRAVATVIGSPGLALLIVANVGALVGAALVRRLAIECGLATEVATRAAWLLTLSPPAFALVWGYAEGLFVALAAGTLLALRRERWWWAAGLGALAGCTRPTGVLLALAALVAASAGLRRIAVGELPARAAAVAGPALGALAYLWWVGREYGDSQVPVRLQDGLRGGTANPIVRVAEAGVDLAKLDVHGLHFPFAVVLLVLVVVAARRLPAVLSVYAGATVLLSLAANNLNSSERYALGAVPLFIALAIVTSERRRRALALAVSGAGLVALTALAWLQIYVP
ncbi:MAG: hypothetical protein QOE63_1929 [Acidimicrobiaceae bacterium]